MRFGLFYELQMPRPWGPDAEEKILGDALEQIELGERAGFEYVWEVEHHFLEEYSHSSAPEVFLAAASQRTKRIRLGHGIVQLPPMINHPVRVAERVSTLDLVSGGRVEFGTGQGSSQVELGGFGVDREAKHAEWEEMLDVVVLMMTEDPFAGFEGRFLSMPPRNIIPKPKQKPHPPLWVACSRRETILAAARKGIGALSFSFVEPEAAKAWVDDYYRLIASPECVPAGLTVNPQVAVVLPFMCHEDEQTAIERGIDGAHFFGFSLAYYYVFGRHTPGVSNIWEEFEKHRREVGFARELIHADAKPLSLKLLESGLGSFRGAVGTPEQISDLVRRYERAGVDLVIFAPQAGHNRHEDICEAIELLGKTVVSQFAEEAPARDRAKQARLARAIGQAVERRRAAPRAGRTAAAPQARNYLITSHGETGRVGALTLPEFSANGRRGAGNRRKGLLHRLVRGKNDEQLERLTPFLAPFIFRGVGKAFRPERAYGFSGEIEYQLRARDQVKRWTIEISGNKAKAKRGEASKPALTMRMSMPTFARLSAGLIPTFTAIVDGRLEAEGDLRLLNRLAEMFGGPSGY